MRNSLILFVCTGNTCRSPMAAALFNALCLAGLSAPSRPEWPLLPASRLSVGRARAVQNDYGLDLSGHRSRPVTRRLLASRRLDPDHDSRTSAKPCARLSRSMASGS